MVGEQRRRRIGHHRLDAADIVCEPGLDLAGPRPGEGIGATYLEGARRGGCGAPPSPAGLTRLVTYVWSTPIAPGQRS